LGRVRAVIEVTLNRPGIPAKTGFACGLPSALSIGWRRWTARSSSQSASRSSSYPEIAARFGITVADVEWHFAGALRVLMIAMDEKDPWWWRFRF